MTEFLFYFFAAAAVAAACAVVFARNPLYNVLALVTVIFCLASLFVLMEAFFVSIILILVYAGAVLVFFLFVVMCLNPGASPSQAGPFRFWGALVAGSFLGMVLTVSQSVSKAMPSDGSLRGTIENIAGILFTDYLLPFELTSLLLLIAVFGIVSLAKGALRSNSVEENA